MIEWRKRLGTAPEDIVSKTLENTTQFYLNCPGENRDVTQRHYKSRFSGLKGTLDNMKELLQTPYFPVSVVSDRGARRKEVRVRKAGKGKGKLGKGGK